MIQQESPLAFTQEAHRPPRSKCSFADWGRGTPSSHGQGGTPSSLGPGGYPSSLGWGVPRGTLPVPGLDQGGTPSSLGQQG